MTALWQGTPLEEIRDSLRADPATALAYAIGNTELRVFLLFGAEPDSPDMPDEAREVAVRILTALLGGADLEQVTKDCARIVAQWRAGRNIQ